jgi:hypothetical protein
LRTFYRKEKECFWGGQCLDGGKKETTKTVKRSQERVDRHKMPMKRGNSDEKEKKHT